MGLLRNGFVVVMLGLCAQAVSQVTHRQDSLLALHRTAEADTDKVWALMETGKLFLNSPLDTALFYLDRALALAQETGFERGIVRCSINKAYVCINQGKYDEAIDLCHAAIPLCAKQGMMREMAAAYNNIGNAWNYQGSHWQAIENYEKSLEVMQMAEMPPHFPIAVQNNLCILYLDMKLYQKGLNSSLDALEKATAFGDELTIAIASELAALASRHLGKDEEALALFRQSVAVARKVGAANVLVSAQSNIADMLLAQGQLTAARQLYRESLALALKNGDRNGAMLNYHGLSTWFLEEASWDSAAWYSLKALEIADSTGSAQYAMPIYLTLSDVEMARGRLSGWKTYRRHYTAIRDTLANESLIRALQELNTKYETEKKEQQIQQLERASELQALRLQRQRILFGGSVIFSLLLLGAAFMGWKYQHNREQLASQEITIQRQRIEQLEKEKQLSHANAVLRGQEEERGRLARDLHDGLGGMLSGVKQSLFAMKGNQYLSETGANALGQVISDLDHSIHELRHIARNMMPEALVRFGLKDALHDYCDHVRLAARLELRFQAFGLENRLPQDVEVIVFRIVQELLNNVVRHAAATQVIVQCIRDGARVHLTVEDNGKGMDAATPDRAHGVGWMNIRSRVNFLEGSLDLHTAPGKGTSVNIEFQLK